ncbi:MAG: Benzoyl-CoA-dihydrodiol lyase [Alphaproteobacteria bacterium MarineAlpha9_Bin1]|nr:MAG: Benzoyl-CoA-dihydrodiol lyase [Alphaproteobacteria bacterium MarineAlpha9_Bin1]
MITFDRNPNSYKHWELKVEGMKATLYLNVSENEGIQSGYILKLNSYDLGVDIELNDAIQRIRFEHPEVKVVIITSAQEKNFSSGANIYMLGLSDHPWKVNFCKFTNETRNGFEDSSNSGSVKFIAAINGVCAGGGYEIALACDEILLIDDRSSTVSLPELPLLGVLPGTGGLTRLVDKRNVRRDIADLFCTNADGIRGQKALEWNLVDFLEPPSKFSTLIEKRTKELSKKVKLRKGKRGVKLKPLKRDISDNLIKYDNIIVEFDRKNRFANIKILGPKSSDIINKEEINNQSSEWWPIKITRELDDAILLLRTNELDIGVIIISSEGSIENVSKISEFIYQNKDNWLINEVIGFYRRTMSRLDISSRSIFTVVEENSCFAGLLFEMVLSADRSYMLNNSLNKEKSNIGPFISLSDINFRYLEMANGQTRIDTRFSNNKKLINPLILLKNKLLDAEKAFSNGLVTIIPDDLDWKEEIRISVEERASFSPDALTGLEANLRFPGNESLSTKIFGRLSAWQNWIFYRPNASGEKGALRLFGSGSRAKFDKKRV